MMRLLALSLMIAWHPVSTLGQQFTIKQLHITPGGGSLSGGEFSVTGKIEKSNPTPAINGGDFSVKGTAASFSIAVHTSGYPQLRIQISPTHHEISWAPDNAVGHVLQWSSTLGPTASWQSDESPLTQMNGRIHATIPRRPGVRFYRLQRTTQSE